MFYFTELRTQAVAYGSSLSKISNGDGGREVRERGRAGEEEREKREGGQERRLWLQGCAGEQRRGQEQPSGFARVDTRDTSNPRRHGNKICHCYLEV